MRQLRIIFMGTPEFAVPSLKILVQNGFNIVAVITAPDKPKGRGQKLGISPVKEFASDNHIPVLQPKNLKSPEFIEELRSYNANLQVVVAFRMLPVIVWEMPSYGTFNLHGSLLPQYRGAAPINWAIINGEKETGVTTFFLKHEIDTGNILFQEKIPISETDNAGTIYETLMNKGAELVLKTVLAIEDDNFKEIPQPENVVIRHAPKIFKETCHINWEKSATEIYNFIRGLSPYPTAWTTINNKIYKIYNSSILTQNNEYLKPGEFSTDHKNYLHFQTKEGIISILALQLQGKKKMGIKEFLRGNKL